MQGMLLVDKPTEWTSFDVVNYVRKIARQNALVEKYKVESAKSAEALDFETFKLATRLPKVKVGHTGTLDPFATGLLVLLVGKEYTRRASELSKLDKTYEVTLELGKKSTTGDPEGEIIAVSDTVPTKEAVEQALQPFRGPIMQTPPAYSAIKIDGQRAYKLAREGKEVKIEPRPVTINRLELIEYAYPKVRLVADVSSGTYIRTLVEDIGAVLQTGAYTTALRRTTVGKYLVTDAATVEGLQDPLPLLTMD